MALTKIGKEGVTGISNSSNATAITISSGELVGIGTTSPASTLTVAHASGSDGRGIRLVNSSNNQTYENRIGTQGVENTSYSIRDITQDGVRLSISNAGEITMPAQPAFYAGPSSAMTNVAHASTITLGTEIFDVGNNVASNVFTAPVTGKYFFSYNVRMEQVDSDSSYVYIQIVTSNRSPIYIFAPNVFDQDADFWTVSQSGIFDMDASDTAFLRFNYVNGSQQVDIGDFTNGTYFSGALIS